MTQTRPTVRLVLLLTALLFSTVAASAAPESGKAPAPLRFNVSPEGYPPFLIVKAGEPITGIMWDVINALAERHGYVVKPMKIPRKRVDSFIQRGDLDATARAREWTDHPHRFVFTDPVLQAKEVFFSRKSSPFVYHDKQDLDGKTIITHLGYHYPTLAPLFKSGEARRYDIQYDEDMFNYMLNGDHFAATIAVREVGQWILRQNHWKDEVYIDDHPVSTTGFRLMFNKAWAPIVKQFNADLAEMRRSGELDQILDRYR